MPTFPEEKALLSALVDEWYEEIRGFTTSCDAIFSERGRHLDKTAAPWDRHDGIRGYVHEIGKKIGRIKQFLQCDPVPWDKVEDEFKDIANYSRMGGGLLRMLKRRREHNDQAR
jgi:hypothetical protein